VVTEQLEEWSMSQKRFENMETAVIHTGYESLQHFGSLTPPIYQSSTFTFETAEQVKIVLREMKKDIFIRD
jgi:cystathionine beta-lyase/cystathionine gamma-synthase